MLLKTKGRSQNSNSSNVSNTNGDSATSNENNLTEVYIAGVPDASKIFEICNERIKAQTVEAIVNP